MRTKQHLSVTLFTCALLLGCGGGEEEVVSHHTSAATDTPSTTTEVVTVSTGGDDEEVTDSTEFKPPFPLNDNPFAPPKQIEEFVVEEEETVDPYMVQDDLLASMPPMRLLGFIKVEGNNRALLDYDGETKLLAKGDRLKHLEVIGVDYPDLTLRQFDTEIAMNLFEQEWQNMPGGNRRGVRLQRSGSSGSRSSASKKPAQPEAETTNVTLPDLPRPTNDNAATGLPAFPDFEAPPAEEQQMRVAQ